MCKHKLHDKYPIKKHVLVCREHRNETENHYPKVSNFTEFPGVEILWKGTVFA